MVPESIYLGNAISGILLIELSVENSSTGGDDDVLRTGL